MMNEYEDDYMMKKQIKGNQPSRMGANYKIKKAPNLKIDTALANGNRPSHPQSNENTFLMDTS
jgi:hypothetical protein